MVKVQWFEDGLENKKFTEPVMSNLNPVFKQPIELDFIFPRKQIFHIFVYDFECCLEKNLIGKVDITLGAVVGAPEQTVTLDLKNDEGRDSGQITIRADKHSRINMTAYMKWQGINLKNYYGPCIGCFKKSNPLLLFNRNDYINPVFVTDVIKENLNPEFPPFSISLHTLCNGKKTRPIKIDYCHQEGDQIISVARANTDFAHIEKKEKIPLFLSNGKEGGYLLPTQVTLVHDPIFLDYIMGGEELSLSVAIDFTASNNDPTNPRSLHYFNPKGRNPYQQVLMEIGEILLNYDSAKRILAMGFGAVPQYPNLQEDAVSHCFPLTGQSWEVTELEGLMDAYDYAFRNIMPSGPTWFSSVIQHTLSAVARAQFNIYSILLILTEGVVSDMDKTIQSIIEASEKPLSIIIVGLGDENFTSMHVLNSDKQPLTDPGSGRTTVRDCVKFAEFAKFKGDARLLARDVLSELPKQLVAYKKLYNLLPNEHIVEKTKILSDSILDNSLKDEYNT